MEATSEPMPGREEYDGKEDSNKLCGFQIIIHYNVAQYISVI